MINKHFKKYFVMSIMIILFLIIGLTLVYLQRDKIITYTPQNYTEEIINHPIYSNYQFNQDSSTINVGIQPMYLPTGIIFEVIKRDKIFRNAIATLGKKIQFYSFLKGEDVNYFFGQGLIDGGVGGDMPVLSAASKFDIVVPAILQKGNVSTVSNKSMLTNDLSRKRIAYAQGSIAHYFILDLLESAGIDIKKVKLIPMEVNVMANALHNNEIDLFSAWEPNVASALKQYPEFFITYQRISTGYLYFSRNLLNSNPLLTNEILAAVIRSINWMKDDDLNLLKACEWNLVEMEKLTGVKSNLNIEDLATLSKHDILGYYSKHEIVVKKEDTEPESSLYKEYTFLNTLDLNKQHKPWNQIARSFNIDIITNIFMYPNEYKLYNYDYEIITSDK